MEGCFRSSTNASKCQVKQKFNLSTGRAEVLGHVIIVVLASCLLRHLSKGSIYKSIDGGAEDQA